MTKPKFEMTQISMQEIVIPAAGPIAATLYQRIKFYCDLNQKHNKKRYFEDNKWWTWQSWGSFNEEYPYWSTSQIRHALSKLQDCGLIETKRTKQFQNSNKYTLISIDEWLMSEDFQGLKQKQRILISKVIKKRNILISEYDKNSVSYDKNSASYAKNSVPNTDVVTIIRDNLLEGQKFFTEISTDKQLQMEYNNLIITYDQARTIIESFGKLFHTTNATSQDFDHTVKSLYLQNVYTKQYPLWSRLVYGVEQSFIGPDIIDAIAPHVQKELDKNPYLIMVLEKLLPDSFDWRSLGISPKHYTAKWSNLCNTVFKTVL